jgi:chloramphenicol 3-O-phosphotransferase
MPKILVLTGAVAAGKSVIAHRYALAHERCADIDVDLLRWMLRQPHQASWDEQEVKQNYPQHRLGVKHACMLAKSFVDEGYNVVITDVVLPELLNEYRQNLVGYTFKIIKLMPTWEECLRRLHERSATISDSEARWCYEKQLALSSVDLTIDNTTLIPDDVVKQLIEFMK